MTYKSISDVDPWPDKCPDVSELSDDELICLLENAEHAPISTWEFIFCHSIKDRLLDCEELTSRQVEVLQPILKTLWDNDSALWGSYKLMLLDITVDFDKVRLEGNEIAKPSHVAASDWLAFWEELSEHDPHLSDSLRVELSDANKEIERLETEVKYWQEKAGQLEKKLEARTLEK